MSANRCIIIGIKGKEKEGIPEIMAALCGTDWLMFRMQHGVLRRDCTLAGGDPVCDYWVVPDKIKDPK